MFKETVTNNDQGRQSAVRLDRDDKTNRPRDIHGAYMKIYAKDLHVKDDLLFLDNKLVVPATIRGTLNSMLHETHPGQFGMKSLAKCLWWPHIYREIYIHGRSCSQCLKAGKNIKVLLGTHNISKLPTLTFANEEINLDFAGPLDVFWGNNKYILLCIDRFTKLPSAKIVNNTPAKNVISFLNDYCHLHGFQRKTRVDHASCFYLLISKTSVKNSTSKYLLYSRQSQIQRASGKIRLYDQIEVTGNVLRIT